MNENILIEVNSINLRAQTNEQFFREEVMQDYYDLKNKPKINFHWQSVIDKIKDISISEKFNYFILVNNYLFGKSLTNKDLENIPPPNAEFFFTKWMNSFNPDKVHTLDRLVSDQNKRFSSSSDVPKNFLRKNNFKNGAYETDMVNGDTIRIGQYTNHGVVIPRQFGSISFSKLYSCAPIISLVKGKEDYIAFLHVWTDFSKNIVDKQVQHWMRSISKIGDVIETIFAPRKAHGFSDTKFVTAPRAFKKYSKKTTVMYRDMDEVKGITNGNGIYFKDCCYHIWDS